MAMLLTLQGGQGLKRMLMPWFISPYTSLALEGPQEPFAEGRPFTMTARVSGVAVSKVTLYRVDSLAAIAESAPDEQGVVRLVVDGLDDAVDFLARGGDGESEPLRVAPYFLPTIESFEIPVTPPDYAAHSADTETEPSFSVLRGSSLRYRLHLKAPAVTVTLERNATAREDEWLTPEEHAALQRGRYGQFVGTEAPETEVAAGPVFRPAPDNPLVWEANWEFPNPGDEVYRIAITGEHGDHVRNDEAWRINVLGDAPPTVRILSDSGSEIKTGREAVRFDLSATDDIRLATARLVFRKPGSTHDQQEIALPPGARTWTGAELLALAPLELVPFDIVAVHAEVEDANTLDGPGIGRSEVVFLEIPLPESEDEGSGGGGGGSGMEPINPLQLQKEILRSTVSLSADAPANEQEALAHDQRQNADYVGMMVQALAPAGLFSLDLGLVPDPLTQVAMILQKAAGSMEEAGLILESESAQNAISEEEAALGALIEAAKMLQEAGLGMPPADAASNAMTFTLSSSPPKASAPKEEQEEEGEGESEKLSDLIEEVKRQLAEQEQLNAASGQEPGQAGEPSESTDGTPSEQAESQQGLAQDARSAAERARDIKPGDSSMGGPGAAAEELERAADLQEDTAEALAGEDATSSHLGEESAAALAAALQELSALLKGGGHEGGAHPPGYERLINDYLRSISYE
jgi:hypothetical protein